MSRVVYDDEIMDKFKKLPVLGEIQITPSGKAAKVISVGMTERVAYVGYDNGEKQRIEGKGWMDL